MQRLEHGDSEFDRHVELPAQLAHVGAARGQHRSMADPDLADGGEGKALVGEVGATHLLQHARLFGSHPRQHIQAPVTSVRVTWASSTCGSASPCRAPAGRNRSRRRVPRPSPRVRQLSRTRVRATRRVPCVIHPSAPRPAVCSWAPPSWQSEPPARWLRGRTGDGRRAAAKRRHVPQLQGDPQHGLRERRDQADGADRRRPAGRAGGHR